MAENVSPLFPAMAEDDRTSLSRHSTGILPSQEIKALLGEGRIRTTRPISDDQIQPASIDLRLGATAYRVRASFLPGARNSVRDKIDALGMHEVDLSQSAVLEKGCVYIVPLMESVRLAKRVSGKANPKSSIGRLDIFTRLITDGGSEFDRVRSAYKGPLFAEVAPRAFSIVVREGSKLCQLRIQQGSPPATDAATRKLQEEAQLVHSEPGKENIAKGIAVSVDLTGDPVSRIVGYKAKKHTDVIDVDKTNHYDPLDFWEPVRAEQTGHIILNPGDFYIMASKEAITVPSDHAAEMIAYDTLVGEFRVHYAGFFDPGFGLAENGGQGTRAVLEVRSHEVPFLLEDGQVVGRLVLERLTGVPDKLYGAAIGSSYQRQGLALAKQFKRPPGEA